MGVRLHLVDWSPVRPGEGRVGRGNWGKNPLTSQICLVQGAREWLVETRIGWEKAPGVRSHPHSHPSQPQL